MRKLRFVLLLMLVCLVKVAKAQVPNFGTTVGDQKLYGYSSLKYRTNRDTWETYSTLQYGISDYFQAGVDLYTSTGNNYIGYVVRGGYMFSKYFKLGGQLTPSFDLSGHHKFSYLTSALYINGDMCKDGRLFYVTDTWLENDEHKLNSAKQWSYIGYTIPIGSKKNDSVTPMAGIIHSWKFDEDVDLSCGCYYTHKNINLYIWGNDLLTDHPKVVAAVEFKFSNK